VYEDGKWVKSQWFNQTVWIATLNNLWTNRTYSLGVTSGFQILTPGHYRIVKELESPLGKVLTAEFYIIDSPTDASIETPLIYGAIVAVLSVLLLWRLMRSDKLWLKKLLGFREY
jgi:hypothetical protein